MSEIYYIDGYNLLHTHPSWTVLADEDLETARETVVEAVSAWTLNRGCRAVVFFDGQGRRPERVSHDSGRPNIEVVYTSSKLSADALIERGVYTAERRHTVIVVTADRGIRDFCLGLGAITMTPENFLVTMDAPPPSRPTARPGNPVGRMEDMLDDETSRMLREIRAKLDPNS